VLRRIDTRERRARIAVRHRLAPATLAGGVAEVAADLVALHSTDPASVFLSAAARLRDPDIGAIERALYEERTIVRVLGMRRTMFVVPVGMAPVVHASCTRAIATRERRNLVKLLREEGGIADAEAWLARVEMATLLAVEAAGEVTGAELSKNVPELRTQILLNVGKKYEGLLNLTTRVLFLLAADEHIVRGRPRGSWISSQFRWSPMRAWLPEGEDGLPTESARAELVRQWLRVFGPGTVADIRWWTGWTAAEVSGALRAIGPAEVELDEGRALVLPGDVEPVPAPDPAVALLPALDPTVMGWLRRDWYLGEHGPALFDRTGNAGPTIWWDGRVVGGWAQRANGEVAYRLLEDIGGEAAAAVGEAAARLAAWIGPVRVTPRFRTPLERELSA
jgi:hypothetical protein